VRYRIVHLFEAILLTAQGVELVAWADWEEALQSEFGLN